MARCSYARLPQSPRALRSLTIILNRELVGELALVRVAVDDVGVFLDGEDFPGVVDGDCAERTKRAKRM